MKVQYKHEILSSFVLWFDHYLSDHAEAYQNVESNFYYYPDEMLTNKTVYGAPFKQFIYDTSVSGANIITSVSGDGQLIPKGTSGMKIDYNEGRILFDNTVSTGINISGSYAVKDFNIYISNQTEEELVVEGKFKNNSRYSRIETYVPPYDQATPAVFISLEGGENIPFAFGGEDETRTMIKAVVLTEDLYQLDGILSVFEDSRQLCVSKIPFTGAPLGEYGDIKSGAYPTGFNYDTISNNYNTDNYYIDSVNTSKLEDEVRKNIPSNLFIGFIDFEVIQPRFPRL